MQMRMQKGVRKDLFLISNFYVCTSIMTPLDLYLNIMF